MLSSRPVTLSVPAGSPANPLRLHVLNCPITIHWQAQTAVGEALHRAFAGLQAGTPSVTPASLEYSVRESDQGLLLDTSGEIERAHDLGDLLYLLDKQITLALQAARRDLVFLHSGAVVTPDGRVIVLTAASGSGKSTLTWALLHHGFGYLSDELAPIDPRNLDVQAYPHALCLKKRPAAPYALPPDTLVTSRSLHVPVRAGAASGRLAAILFVDHRHPAGQPVLTGLGSARAALHLYPNTLNPLAHANDGLDALTEIARSVPCYELNTADLPAACEAVRAL